MFCFTIDFCFFLALHSFIHPFCFVCNPLAARPPDQLPLGLEDVLIHWLFSVNGNVMKSNGSVLSSALQADNKNKVYPLESDRLESVNVRQPGQA